MRWLILLALSCACAAGQWESAPADRPASPRELSFLRVTVIGPPALAEALTQQGFAVVSHRPFDGDLELVFANGVATLRSDGYFIDELHGDDPVKLAAQLARSARVAAFVRDSGTVEQRNSPGM
jgi:hypothetical protein